jgi:hypothetical protein
MIVDTLAIFPCPRVLFERGGSKNGHLVLGGGLFFLTGFLWGVCLGKKIPSFEGLKFIP